MRKKDEAVNLQSFLCSNGFPATVYHGSLPVRISLAKRPFNPYLLNNNNKFNEVNACNW